jgi:hypothetical protein
MERVGPALGIVGGIDPGIARRRQSVAGDFSGAGRATVDDNDLLTVNADPHALRDQLVGHRVPRRAIADRRLVVDHPRQAEGDREGLVGHRMKPLAFVGQELDRRLSGLAMLAGVDLLAECVAGGPELGE